MPIFASHNILQLRILECNGVSGRDCASVAIGYAILNDAKDSMMFSEYTDT